MKLRYAPRKGGWFYVMEFLDHDSVRTFVRRVIIGPYPTAALAARSVN